MANNIDKQQIEFIGTAALSAALIRQGFELARPIRDHGIDLTIFTDSPGSPFGAVPLQVKSHSGTGLKIYNQKYKRFHRLIHAIVWYATTDAPRFFLLDEDEMEETVPPSSRCTASWTGPKGSWFWKQAPGHILERMVSFENRWDWLRNKLNWGLGGPNEQ